MQINCLRARSGDQQFAVPVDAVDHMGDFSLEPSPPLSRDGVIGVTEERGVFFLVVSAEGDEGRANAAKLTTCLIIRDHERGFRWALRVDEVGEFFAVNVDSPGESSSDWYQNGVDSEGQDCLLLNTTAIESWLEGAGELASP